MDLEVEWKLGAGKAVRGHEFDTLAFGRPWRVKAADPFHSSAALQKLAPKFELL